MRNLHKKINIPTQAHDTHKRVESSAKTTLTEKDKQKVDLMIEDIKANKNTTHKKIILIRLVWVMQLRMYGEKKEGDFFI